MRRSGTNDPYTCVTCEVEINGTAVFHLGITYYCPGCAAGGPCTCSYDEEVRDHRRSGHQTAVSRPDIAVVTAE
jgi:hypothetical protein